MMVLIIVLIASPALPPQYIVYHWLMVTVLTSLFIAVLTSGYEKVYARGRLRHACLNIKCNAARGRGVRRGS